MRKRYLLTVLCLGLSLLGMAHEFWLQPKRFFAAVGDVVPIEIMVGENFIGERSEGKKNRIVQYVHWVADKKEDLAPGLTNDHYGVADVRMQTPGTHLIAFANTPKFLSMRADSFLLYLKEDGLDNVMLARQQQGDTRKRSRELYQRCVKTLIQVDKTPDRTFSVNTGMPLEIIPKRNPYGITPGQAVDFQVLFENRPLPAALVRYWNRSPTNQLHEEQQRSDSQGRVQFRLRPGSNMVSLVRMVPYTPAVGSDQPAADWISYWGSLTFGSK